MIMHGRMHKNPKRIIVESYSNSDELNLSFGGGHPKNWLKLFALISGGRDSGDGPMAIANHHGTCYDQQHILRHWADSS